MNLNYSTVIKNKDISIPCMCPCCGNYEDRSFHTDVSEVDGKLVSEKKYPSLIPIFYCEKCRRHAEKYRSKLKYLIFLVPIIVFFAGMFLGSPDWIETLWVLSIPGSIVLFFYITWLNIKEAQKMMGSTCVTPDWAIYMNYQPRGMILDEAYFFYFTSEGYANKFASLNNTEVHKTKESIIEKFLDLLFSIF
jgi:hypothetical protein